MINRNEWIFNINKKKVMQNDLTKRYYSFFVHFYPLENRNEFKDIEEKAQTYYVNFLNKHDFGDKLLSTEFIFLVEKEIDYDRQNDCISTSTYLGLHKFARLTLHFDNEYFVNAGEKEKFKLTLNGILFLLNHWRDNLKIPKGIPLTEIIYDFTNELQSENLIFSGEITSKVFVKLINPFRFSFMRHHFQGLKDNDLLFDTNHIEKFLNNRLYHTDFGKSIKEVFFSYDIFDFGNDEISKKYIDNEKKYQFGKNKDLGFMEQYDSERFLYNEQYLEATKYEQVQYLHKGLLNAILRIKEMKRGPKDFNVYIFYKEIDKLMTEYEERYCH